MVPSKSSLQRFVRRTLPIVVGAIAVLIAVTFFSYYTPVQATISHRDNTFKQRPGQQVPSQAVLGKTSTSGKQSPGQQVPSQAVLGKTSTSGKQSSVPSVSLGGNPYSCTGRSDNPHLSTHVPGSVAAQGHTDCSVNLPYIHVDSTLYRQDCFLIFCSWTQVGYDEQTLYGARSVRAIPSYTCNGSSSHLYEIDSYHEIQDSAGNIYYAYTATQATIACG